MDSNNTKQQERSSSSENKQDKMAVPYIAPPPPDNSSQKRFRSPLVNGVLVALVILLGGFMTYQYVGHTLTQLAGESDVREVTPSPTIVPTDTPLPTTIDSPTP